MATHQHLVQVSLADLHPTQMTVGSAEVLIERDPWPQLKRKERDSTGVTTTPAAAPPERKAGKPGA